MKSTNHLALLTAYHQAEQTLEQFITPEHTSYMAADHKRDGSWFLNRTKHLLTALGSPETQLPQLIHVAGSSGKGSVSTMMAGVLRAAGSTVGLYTSPYVTAATENIQLNGQLINAADFAAAIERVVPVVDDIKATTPDLTPSYADIFFAAALLYFVEAQCDWVVIETACGGRFDKTNTIPAPVLALLTPITYDHTNILGETLPEIAWHKAGIIKPGTQAVFSSEIQPEVQAVFSAEAQAVGVPLTYTAPATQHDTAMPGAHQQANAALVSAAAAFLQIDDNAIAQGLASSRLPARVEIMPQPAGAPTVIVDGAHSPAKIEALIHTLDQFKPYTKLHLIFSAKETKDATGLLAPLAAIADTITLTSWTLPGFKSHDPTILGDWVQQTYPQLPLTIEVSGCTATSTVINQAGPDDLVIITGSLYMVGEIRQLWYPLQDIVIQQTCWPIVD